MRVMDFLNPECPMAMDHELHLFDVFVFSEHRTFAHTKEGREILVERD